MSLNDMADFQRKIHDFQMDVTRHLEMMAAAYMKATDIPPEECELVVEILPDKMVYRFQRRRTPLAPDKWESAPSTGIVPPLSLSTSQSESTPPKPLTQTVRRLGGIMSDCTCVSCDECGGSGSVWFSFNHKYLGKHRCDDLDELETCESCGGSGIEEMCDHCRELEEEAEWREQEAAEQYMHPTGLTSRQKDEVRQIVESVIKGALHNPPCG